MSAQEFVRQYLEGTDKLTAAYGYNPAEGSDSCGVGLIVALDGKRRRDVVVAGIDALKAVWHRGAVDADGKTGDGAGIHIEIPQDFFKEHVRDSSGQDIQGGRIAVGTVFLPRIDMAAQERCRTIVEAEILRFGHQILGWRQVPVDISVIGEKANATRPEIEQILIGRGDPKLDNREFEKQLYILRRRMEKAALAENIGEFYVCSLSCRSLIYKGMFLAEHLSAFYPDLLDERFTSRFAIFHQRYSTNTFPQWKLAQPFRVLAHNGEINTLLGNVNWMKSHEARLEHEGFVGLLGARQRVRAAGAWSSQPADGQGHDDPGSVGLEPQHPGQAPCHVQLRQRRDGAVGRPGGDRRGRGQVGAGRPRPQRPQAHALRRDLRRPADRRLRIRHGAAGRGQDPREGPAGSG
jgi:glutamate synthase (NADPH/NADH) large chain